MAPRLGTAECLHCGAPLETWSGESLPPVWCAVCVAKHCCVRRLDAKGVPHCVHANKPKDHRRFAKACILAATALLAASCGTGVRGNVGVGEAASSSPRSHVLPDGGRDLTDPTTTSSTEAHAPAVRASRSEVRPRLSSPPGVAAPTYAEIDGMPVLLRRIGGCESSGDPDAPINWTAQNRHSTASGGFQELDSTWRGWASTYGSDVGAPAYARAMYAPPSVQLTVTRRAFDRQGTGPWESSRSCWA